MASTLSRWFYGSAAAVVVVADLVCVQWVKAASKKCCNRANANICTGCKPISKGNTRSYVVLKPVQVTECGGATISTNCVSKSRKCQTMTKNMPVWNTKHCTHRSNHQTKTLGVSAAYIVPQCTPTIDCG
jgi:hypothetical protein